MDLTNLLDDGDGATVTLLAGDTQLVAHRAVLAARSPVFEAVLQHHKLDSITITDVEGPVLRQLLVYMYTLKAPQMPNMDQMLAAAEKYCLSGLKAACKQEPVKKVCEIEAVDLATLLDAVDGATVTLSTEETQLVAHKAVLTARSPVFASMFHHDTLEANTGQVHIPDVEGPVVRQLLCYCYTLQAPQRSSMAPQLLTAADKYGLLALKAACEQQVVAQLIVENAAASAVLAVRHSCPSLRQAAVKFIKAHTHQVMMTQGWADAVLGHPHSVLELTRLIAEPEPEPPQDIGHAHTRVLSREEKGRQLLHAAMEGAVEEVWKLLLSGREMPDMNVADGDKRTALHWAAGKGHVAAVRILLESGADFYAKDRWRKMPLHYAADSGHAAVVRLLVAFHADVNARCESQRTPLHYAASSGHTEVVAVLLQNGASTWCSDGLGKTPGHDAKLWNNQQLTELLQ